MGAQEQLWCAVQMDDPEHVRRCLAWGASASFPGPHGNAMDLAQAHQAYRVSTALGWRQETAMDEDLSLEKLDQAIAQIDLMKSGLGVSQPGDDFLDILPFLGNARLVPEDPMGWAGLPGLSSHETRTLFRMTHQHQSVLVMLNIDTPPTLLLSEAGARKWAPRLLEAGPSLEMAAGAGNTLN